MAIRHSAPGTLRASATAPRSGAFVNQQTGAVSRSQPDRGQIGRQNGPPFGAVGSRGGGASAFASQPGSSQTGGRGSCFLAVGNQRNSATPLASLWQPGS